MSLGGLGLVWGGRKGMAGSGLFAAWWGGENSKTLRLVFGKGSICFYCCYSLSNAWIFPCKSRLLVLDS